MQVLPNVHPCSETPLQPFFFRKTGKGDSVGSVWTWISIVQKLPLTSKKASRGSGAARANEAGTACPSAPPDLTNQGDADTPK